MPYEKVGTMRLSKSKKAVLIFFDDKQQLLSVSVSSAKEVLDGKRASTNVSRIVNEQTE